MKFKFDPNQAYQIQAVEAAVDLLQGQPRLEAAVQFQLGTLSAVANRIDLTEADLLKNLQRVQSHNQIIQDQVLKYVEEEIDAATGCRTVQFPNFSMRWRPAPARRMYIYGPFWNSTNVTVCASSL